MLVFSDAGSNAFAWMYRRFCVVVGLLISGCMLPGGGGSEQIVPDTVHAGSPAKFQLVMSVADINWIRGRFKDLKLFYRLAGDSVYREVHPARRFSVDHGREGYDFVIPPYPVGTRGTLEYRFTYRFDGHPNSVPGLKAVRVE
jgi:hypothetical protein